MDQAGSLHPSSLYVLASRLAVQGKAAANARVLFSALTEQVGRPVNEYIAGDPDEWIAAMRWALDWDAATDNHVTSKTGHAAELAQVRGGLERLISKVDASRDEIRRERTANGLENR